jgi:XTP/dITP diphosphohydrolase
VVGEITREPMGEHGFGFDPVMFIPSHGQTFAQMTELEKNAISHRGQSARLMCELMRKRWWV